MLRRSPFQRCGRTALLLAGLALAGCPVAFDANLGAEVRVNGPDGRSCAKGGDGEKLAICQIGLETNDYEYEARAVAKGLGEDLEGTTDIQGDAGGHADANGEVYQTFVVVSDMLVPGTPVDLVIVAHLFGSFWESPPAALSQVTYFVEYWTDGCNASGCGAPVNPTVVADFDVLSGLVPFFTPSVEEPLVGLAVGDVFGVRADLRVRTASPAPGGRARADAFGDFDIRDPAPVPDAAVARLDLL
jgi:hypothetical protein